jgi:hypothetical protein
MRLAKKRLKCYIGLQTTIQHRCIGQGDGTWNSASSPSAGPLHAMLWRLFFSTGNIEIPSVANELLLKKTGNYIAVGTKMFGIGIQ